VSQIHNVLSSTEDSRTVQGGWALLLEEPAVALWASEAAARYGLSALAALGLLAQALLLDPR
jgi:hypothetical protein